METIEIETVIIGAGQAGLATGYHLQRRGRPYVILDANSRLGDNWRRQWDTLKLYSPAQYDSLPGLPFPARKWTYPGKDQVGDYLDTYARHFELPVTLETRVQTLEREDEQYVVTTDRGRYRCDNVVVATGRFGRTPQVPAIADQLDPAILQLHSSEYRRPGQLRGGQVLVVGASHSGTDIAFEVAETHLTILAGRDCGQIPPRLESRRMRLVFPMLLVAWRHIVTRSGAAACLRVLATGGGPDTGGEVRVPVGDDYRNPRRASHVRRLDVSRRGAGRGARR